MNRMLFFLQLFLLYSSCCLSSPTDAPAVTYTEADSIKVVQLLADGNSAYVGNKSMNLMLYYGLKLRGVPYVGHTLEVNKTEQLVVNLRQLDCTTFVETVFALSLTTKQGSVGWDDYCRNLQSVRYENGVPEGYPSRNHYFLWWVERNKEKGFVTTPLDDDMRKREHDGAQLPSYVSRQRINIDYMTTHSSAYIMLKDNADDIAAISRKEKSSEGKTVYYVPASKTGLGKAQLGNYIKDGDILAIATKKKGLDTSHIGIASWGKDGKLHLLNASQVRKQVVLEPMTLLKYMGKHPTHLGIWVIHPTL